jgi:hypothetical protein
MCILILLRAPRSGYWLFATSANDVFLLQTMLIAFGQYIEADTSVLCDSRAAGSSSSLVLLTGNEDAVFQKDRRLGSEYARKYLSCIRIECQVKHHLNAAATPIPMGSPSTHAVFQATILIDDAPLAGTG